MSLINQFIDEWIITTPVLKSNSIPLYSQDTHKKVSSCSSILHVVLFPSLPMCAPLQPYDTCEQLRQVL